MPLKHLVMGLAIVATIPTAFTTAEAADGFWFHCSLIALVHSRAQEYLTLTD